MRSPTLANILTERGFNTRACGSLVRLALIPISSNLIRWAQHIIFVNRSNFDDTIQLFSEEGEVEPEEIESKATIFRVDDEFDFNCPLLRKQLEQQLDETGLFAPRRE